ncbi:flagellar hook protein FlgE [Rhodoferax lacus]|uniref:Flagellar hook protein FlgE n=1 Tax=Rhodoferax lacus TaxID=2184758 RepID=A0A3E1R6Q0_9BURK|nr:flagellar hook protein FlgE [Rhodoferax lacus]RFO95048.1 flagellar hook protein FlgE [Rhodoferax lacus]
MSFQTGLSGLSASSQSLDVIGNNIANANTVGMKSSRGEFSDLVASAIGAGGTSNTAGIGVALSTISQNFSQGNVSITGNTLDVAVNGGGFFQVTKTDGTTAYTRDGQFKLDKDGNIVNNGGSFLMGYPTDINGVRTSQTPQNLVVPTGAPIAAKQTSAIVAEFNLDARAPVATSVTPNTPLSTYGTSLTVFDSQGQPQALNLYFKRIASQAAVAAAPPVAAVPGIDKWEVYTGSTAATATLQGQLQFDQNGVRLASSTFPPAAGLTITPPAGTAVQPFAVTVDTASVTQYGTNFAVSNLSQDGYTSGEFTGLAIDNKGVITTRYSNGQTQKSGGMIALADFRNVQGLAPVGGGEFLESYKSGAPVLGQPTVGRFGELRSGAVEESNVDLTAELVNMMTAQRNYQANAQTIKTQDQVMSTLVNLR